jgi:hypothetical protein
VQQRVNGNEPDKEGVVYIDPFLIWFVAQRVISMTLAIVLVMIWPTAPVVVFAILIVVALAAIDVGWWFWKRRKSGSPPT